MPASRRSARGRRATRNGTVHRKSRRASRDRWALVAGPGGTFTAEGTHTPGWGGPEIERQVRPTYRVRYSGEVRGDIMSLQGTVENGVVLGPFTLWRGAEPIIFRCL